MRMGVSKEVHSFLGDIASASEYHTLQELTHPSCGWASYMLHLFGSDSRLNPVPTKIPFLLHTNEVRYNNEDFIRT